MDEMIVLTRDNLKKSNINLTASAVNLWSFKDLNFEMVTNAYLILFKDDDGKHTILKNRG